MLPTEDKRKDNHDKCFRNPINCIHQHVHDNFPECFLEIPDSAPSEMVDFLPVFNRPPFQLNDRVEKEGEQMSSDVEQLSSRNVCISAERRGLLS